MSDRSDAEKLFEEFFRRATRAQRGANPEPEPAQEPYAYQRRLALAPKLPGVLQIPTGSGKTLAVLLAWLFRRRLHPKSEMRANTPRRLVYCLPMRVLVEQTRQVAVNVLERLGADLEPTPRLYMLMGGDSDDDWVRNPERDAILIGTQDMLLSRALNRGYGLGRFRWPQLFGLLNNDSLWVLDEVQLMGVGLTTSCQLAGLRRKLGTFGPAHTLWMSATLDPQSLETIDHRAPGSADVFSLAPEEREEPPLRKRLHAPKTVRHAEAMLSKLGGKDLEQYAAKLAKELAQRHRAGALTLAVFNTVSRASAVWAALNALRNPRRSGRKSAETPHSKLPLPLLIHSRFRPEDRAAKLADLTAPLPEEGRIVISTQVVEAGVDISARELFTELAPWPSLVQRFGRCNRAGELPESDPGSITWIDIDFSDDKSARDLALPYTPDELCAARERLEQLKDARPALLPPVEPERQLGHVLRHRDLVDLFDTTADLSGADIDVSRFVRESDDKSLQVFWRTADGWHAGTGRPPKDERRALREELCSAPVGELRDFLRRTRKDRQRNGWIWDHLDGNWRYLEPDELRPGLLVLLRADLGGYSSERGWSPESDEPVSPVPPAERNLDDGQPEGNDQQPEESVDDDHGTFAPGRWVELDTHLDDAAAEARGLCISLSDVLGDDKLASIIERAARWHDAGKAHAAFQHMLLSPLEEAERAARVSTLWAKSPHRARHRRKERFPEETIRPCFRHELASALALWVHENRLLADLDEPLRSLLLYLVAAHHGQIRLAIRSLDGEYTPEDGRRFARGVWDGDELPGHDLGGGVELSPTILSLAPMEIGLSADGRPSWSDRMVRLRERLGPFRLAYLEALVIAADWRASAAPGGRL